MKFKLLLLAVLAAFSVSGCYVYDPYDYGGHHHEHHRYDHDHDQDRGYYYDQDQFRR